MKGTGAIRRSDRRACVLISCGGEPTTRGYASAQPEIPIHGPCRGDGVVREGHHRFMRSSPFRWRGRRDARRKADLARGFGTRPRQQELVQPDALVRIASVSRRSLPPRHEAVEKASSRADRVAPLIAHLTRHPERRGSAVEHSPSALLNQRWGWDSNRRMGDSNR